MKDKILLCSSEKGFQIHETIMLASTDIQIGTLLLIYTK